MSVGVAMGRAVVDDRAGVEMGVEAGRATHIPCMLSSVPLGQTHRNDPTVFSQDCVMLQICWLSSAASTHSFMSDNKL